MQIFYTNDMHNRLKALDWLESRSTQWTDAEAPLLLDGGDAIGGSNTAFRLDEPALQRMRKLGFRAMAMGNREFHYFRWVQRWRECERGFPILAANLHDLRSAHQPWRPHLVIDRPAASDGLKTVALIGLTPVQFPHRHFWEKVTGFRFDPPKDTLAQYLPELERQCDLVIVMSHLGLEHDRVLAREFPSLRLILGAHCHSVTTPPETVGACTIVQGGSHSRHLGRLNLQKTNGALSVDWALENL